MDWSFFVVSKDLVWLSSFRFKTQSHCQEEKKKKVHISIVNERKDLLDPFNIISDCCKFTKRCQNKTMALTDNSTCWQRHGTAECSVSWWECRWTTLPVFGGAELVQILWLTSVISRYKCNRTACVWAQKTRASVSVQTPLRWVGTAAGPLAETAERVLAGRRQIAWWYHSVAWSACWY